MGTALADVIVHVREDLSEEAILNMEQDLRANDGVISVGHRQGQSHMMMVVFDADITPASNLLDSFHAHGMHASLVGL
jgi:hypothetical protein